MKSPFKNVLAASITLIWIGFPAVSAGGDYEDLLNKGKEFRESRSYPEAIQRFQEAMLLDSTRHEAYFELAIVNYRTANLRAAQDFANLALEYSPDAQRTEIEKMLEIIGNKRKAETFESEGDAALAKGLLAKAAESYRMGYYKAPKNGALGLRAAQIYAENLSKPLEAAGIWQRILKDGDQASKAAAQTELDRHQKAIVSAGEALLRAARSEKKEGGASWYRDLVSLADVFPNRLDIKIEAAIAGAKDRSVDCAIIQLRAANKLGITGKQVSEIDEFSFLIGEKEGTKFYQFLVDSYGKDIANPMRDKGLARSAQLEEERKEYERKEFLRKSRNYRN